MKYDDKVIHVTFNPKKQTEADKITFSVEGLDKLFQDILMTDAELDAIIEDQLNFDKAELKQYVEDLLALGYDEVTAWRLAKDLAKYEKNN